MATDRVTVARLAEHFHLTPDYLAGRGVTDSHMGVVIDYGPGTRKRVQTSLNGDRRFHWENGEGDIVPYGARINGVLDRAREVGLLVLVEGESDCWVLHLADFPALGLPGAEMIGLLDREHLERIAQLFVVREPDEAGAKFVENVVARIAILFPDGEPPLSIVTMDEGIKDPAALLVDCGDVYEFGERLVDRMQSAEPVDWSDHDEKEPEPPQLLLRPVVDSAANPPAPLGPLVESLILPGDKVVIGGARGAAKSWLAMGMGLQLARGEGEVLGRFPVARPLKVLHAHGELLDDASTVARWEKLASGDIPGDLLETFDRWRIRPVKRRETYRDENGSFQTEWYDAEIDRRVGFTLEHWKPDVLVIDPWRTFFLGEENSNTEVEAALATLDHLADRHGLTIVLTHHFSQYRQGADPEDWWRGASRLADWASVRITLAPGFKDKVAERQGMTRLQARQYARVRLLLRRLPTPEDFGAKWNPETGWWESWKLPGEDSHSKLQPDDVLEALRRAGGEWPSTRKGADQLGTTSDTLKPVLERLAAEGRVQKLPGSRNADRWKLVTMSGPEGSRQWTVA